MKLNKLMIIFCFTFLLCGCSAVSIQQDVTSADKPLDENDLIANESLLKQVDDLKALFTYDDVELGGTLMDLLDGSDSYSYKNFQKHITERGTIVFEVSLNNPKYITVAESYYNIDGQLENYEVIKEKKYPSINGHHRTEPHYTNKEKDSAIPHKVITEDDGYEYMHCNICGEYTGSYGKPLSAQLKESKSNFARLKELCNWTERVENNSIQKKEVLDISEGEYIENTFSYSEVLVMDEIIYKYTPYSNKGTKLEINFLPASLYTPAKYEKVLKDLNIDYLLPSSFSLYGDMETLEFRSVSNYFDDTYYTLDDKGNYIAHPFHIPIKVNLVFDENQKVTRVSFNSISGMFSPEAYLSTETSSDIIKMLTKMEDVREEMATSGLSQTYESLSLYFAYLNANTGGSSDNPPTRHDDHGDVNGLKWNFTLRASTYGGKGWSEAIFTK